MEMDNGVEIITVDAGNVAKQGFFCYKSKRKTEGFRRKLDWVEQRLAEGMRVKIVQEGARQVGFIEYIPGEYAWRAVEAPGYMVIHCLWVVGRAKKKGYGSRLLEACVEDAREMGKHGVAMVTSSGHWLAGKKLLVKNGFEAVDQAPPSFDLLIRRFGDAPAPVFPTDWDERLAQYGPGMTIVRSDQCPYVASVTEAFAKVAGEAGTPFREVELHSARQVREQSPSPYGVFNVVHDGALLAYHWLREEKLLEMLKKT
jgi:GNAT superfamily N-acetyltransferase